MRHLLLFCLAAATALGASPAPTYNQDIAPILYKNCATCHRPGEVAPFSLLTYQDTAKRASLIASITKSRVMPPWKAEPGYGDFKDARRLTDEQIALIQQWAKSGAPEGDPASKPNAPVFTDGWQLGQPDKIVYIPAKFAVSPDGPDQYRCFVIPLNLDQDTYVGGVEFRPGNRRIVHHALVFTDARGEGRKLAAGSPDGGYTCFGSPGFRAGILSGWAPGATPAKLAAGSAITLRKGTDLVIQLHYHPDGKPEQDQSTLGLIFTGPPTVGRALMVLASDEIDIQPGESHYVVKASMELPDAADLVRITPHAHYICKDMKVTARFPDGSTAPLLWIKDWDFNWQGGYNYAKPVPLPKGTRIELEYTYDNSVANPRNPSNPPVRITYGEETTNEMAIAFLSFALPTPADAAAFTRALYSSRSK